MLETTNVEPKNIHTHEGQIQRRGTYPCWSCVTRILHAIKFLAADSTSAGVAKLSLNLEGRAKFEPYPS